MDFFAGEAIDVGARKCTTARNRVPEWVIPVIGDHRLAAVDEVSDVAVAIGEIESVRDPIAGGVATGAAQQAADSSGSFERAAEVIAARVPNCRRVAAVALLDDAIAIVNVEGRALQDAVGVLQALAQTAQAIIRELGIPRTASGWS